MRKPLLVSLLAGALALGATPVPARTIVVASNVAWTDTGMRVTRGQSLRFESAGEIRLSFNGSDTAGPAGAPSGRTSEKAPIPSFVLGALIGRINNGKPFAIGNTPKAIQMPVDGTLFLGVNDDYPADNSGNLVVKVWTVF